MRPLFLTTLLLLAIAARAQTVTQPVTQPASDPTQTASPSPADGPTATLTIAARLVSLEAIVRDKKGDIVHGLTKDDFQLRVDGKPQPVRYFNADSDLPLSLGLLVDTSGSMALHIQEEQQNSADFLEAMFGRPQNPGQDRAFLVRFARTIELLQPPTADLAQLKSSLATLAIPTPVPPDPHAKRDAAPHPAAGPPPAARRQPGTLLYDSIAASAIKISGKEPGRRALVVLTDGDDNGSRISLDDAIHTAQNADTAVYSILYLRAGAGGPGLALSGQMALGHSLANNGNTIMERIATETGGRCFIISKQMPMDRVFALIAQDLHSQYRLGFTPPSPGQPSASQPPQLVHHTLELKTRDTHLTVQARNGYYAQP